MPTLISLHALNILIHVTFGTVAICAGLYTLSRQKGDRGHRVRGRLTLSIATVSLASAVFGAIVFRGKLDLLAISILVSYHLWAGVRALRLVNRGRHLADCLPAVLITAGGIGLFLMAQISAANYWSPAKIYAAAGGMIAFGVYDLLRMGFPIAWRIQLNSAEHAFRMTCLVVALISVASATLFSATLLQGAYSALVPSVIFTGLAIVLSVRAARRASRNALGVVPSASLNALLKAEREL